jgi:phosphoenolpyruvate phosphomutase
MSKVFVPMCADVIHVGHVNILTKAAEHGDVTVLLMTDDAVRSYKREPAMSMQQREAILRAMKAVKEVIPCDGPSSYLPLVQEHKPGFFIHGDDWKVSGGHVEIGECEVD